MKKILCIGPVPPPITGQAFAFFTFVESTKFDTKTIDRNLTGITGLHKVWLSFRYLIKVFNNIVFNRFDGLYLTTSRSSPGFLLDAVALVLYRIFSNGIVVNHLHGADFKCFRDRSNLKKIIDYVYSFIDVSIVLSESMREQYACYPKMKVEVIPNFSDSSIDENHLRRKAVDFRNNKRLKVLFLSNLMYSKGITYLVDSIHKLNKQGLDIELRIAGGFFDDKLMSAKNMECYIFKKLSSHIKYFGVASGKEKIDLLNWAHVVALPTFYPTEAQPISLIEAMAHGCIVLSTNHNYNSDFLGANYSLLVQPQNESELSDSLVNVYGNRADFCDYFFEAHAVANRTYHIDNYINSIESLFEGVK